MEDFGIHILGFVFSIFAALVGAFVGGSSSLIMFTLLLMFVPGGYVSLLAVTKVNATALTILSGTMHSKRNIINYKFLSVVILAALSGTAVGTYLVQYHLDEMLYSKLLGVVLLAVAVILFFVKDLGVSNKKIRSFSPTIFIQTAIFAFFVNIFNGLFGGAVILLTLYFVLIMRMPFITAIAHTMITYAFVDVIQTSYLVMTEPVDLGLILFVILGAIIGAFLGTYLQYMQGNLWVRRAVIVLMLIIGVKMFFF